MRRSELGSHLKSCGEHRVGGRGGEDGRIEFDLERGERRGRGGVGPGESDGVVIWDEFGEREGGEGEGDARIPL